VTVAAISIARRETRKNEMPSKKSETIWVVVFVQSGVIVEVKAYRNPRSAERRAQIWRSEMDENEDDVQSFAVKI
jgi:hypothetical protein